MAWTAGHTHAATTTLPIASAAHVGYTCVLTHQDFPAADRGAWADHLAAGTIEAATDSGGLGSLGVVVDWDNVAADQFRLLVGPIDRSAAVGTPIHWRVGAAVDHTGDVVNTTDRKVIIPGSVNASDVSGNGNDATPVGGFVAGTGIGFDGVTPCMLPDGVDDKLLVPYSPASGDGTIQIRCKLQQPAESYQTLFYAIGGNRIWLRFDSIAFGSSAANVGLGWQYGQSFRRVASGLPDGTWATIALVHESGVSKLLVNGVVVDSVSQSAPDVSGNFELFNAFDDFLGQTCQDFSHDIVARSVEWLADDHSQVATPGQASTSPLAVISGEDVTVTPGSFARSVTVTSPTAEPESDVVVAPGALNIAVSAVAPTAAPEGDVVVTPGAFVVPVSCVDPVTENDATVVVTPGAINVPVACVSPTIALGESVVVTPGSWSGAVAAASPSAAAEPDVVVAPGQANIAVSCVSPIASIQDGRVVTPHSRTIQAPSRFRLLRA